MIYLDNAATTALSPAAIQAMTKTMTVFGNPPVHTDMVEKLVNCSDRRVRILLKPCILKAIRFFLLQAALKATILQSKAMPFVTRTEGSILSPLLLSTMLS